MNGHAVLNGHARQQYESGELITKNNNPFKPDVRLGDFLVPVEKLSNSKQKVYQDVDKQLNYPRIRAGELSRFNPRRRDVFIQGPAGTRPVDLMIKRACEKFKAERNKDLDKQSNIVLLCNGEVACEEAARKLIIMSEPNDRENIFTHTQVITGQNLDRLPKANHRETGSHILIVNSRNLVETVRQKSNEKHRGDQSEIDKVLKPFYEYVGLLPRSREERLSTRAEAREKRNATLPGNLLDYLYIDDVHEFTTASNKAILDRLEAGMRLNDRADHNPAEIIGTSFCKKGTDLGDGDAINISDIFSRELFVPHPDELVPKRELPKLIGGELKTTIGEPDEVQDLKPQIGDDLTKPKIKRKSLITSTKDVEFCRSMLTEFETQLNEIPGRYASDSVEIRMPNIESCNAMVEALGKRNVVIGYSHNFKTILNHYDNSGNLKALNSRVEAFDLLGQKDCKYLVHCGTFDGISRPVDAKILALIPRNDIGLETHFHTIRTPYPKDLNKPTERFFLYLSPGRSKASSYEKVPSVLDLVDEMNDRHALQDDYDTSKIMRTVDRSLFKNGQSQASSDSHTTATTAGLEVVELDHELERSSWKDFLIQKSFNSERYAELDFYQAVRLVADEAAPLLTTDPDNRDRARIRDIYRGTGRDDPWSRDALGYILGRSDLNEAICRYPYQTGVVGEQEALIRINWVINRYSLNEQFNNNWISELNRISKGQYLNTLARTIYNLEPDILLDDELIASAISYCLGSNSVTEEYGKNTYGTIFQNFLIDTERLADGNFIAWRLNSILPTRFGLEQAISNKNQIRERTNITREINSLLSHTGLTPNLAWLNLIGGQGTALEYFTEFLQTTRNRSSYFNDHESLRLTLGTLIGNPPNNTNSSLDTRRVFLDFLSYLALKRVRPDNLAISRIVPNLFTLKIHNAEDAERKVEDLLKTAPPPQTYKNWLRLTAKTKEGKYPATTEAETQAAAKIVGDFLFDTGRKDILIDEIKAKHVVSVLLGGKPNMIKGNGRGSTETIDSTDRDLFIEFYDYQKTKDPNLAGLEASRNQNPDYKFIDPKVELSKANGHAIDEAKKNIAYVLRENQVQTNTAWVNKLAELDPPNDKSIVGDRICTMAAQTILNRDPSNFIPFQDFDSTKRALEVLLGRKEFNQIAKSTANGSNRTNAEKQSVIDFCTGLREEFDELSTVETSQIFPDLIRFQDEIKTIDNAKAAIRHIIAQEAWHPNDDPFYLRTLTIPGDRLTLIAETLFQNREQLDSFKDYNRLKQAVGAALRKPNHSLNPELNKALIADLYKRAKQIDPNLDNLQAYRLCPDQIALTDRLLGNSERTASAIKIVLEKLKKGSDEYSELWFRYIATPLLPKGQGKELAENLFPKPFADFLQQDEARDTILTNHEDFMAALNTLCGKPPNQANIDCKALLKRFCVYFQQQYPGCLPNHRIHQAFPTFVDLDRDALSTFLRSVVFMQTPTQFNTSVDGSRVVNKQPNPAPITLKVPNRTVTSTSSSTEEPQCTLLEFLEKHLLISQDEIIRWYGLPTIKIKHFDSAIKQVLEQIFSTQDKSDRGEAIAIKSLKQGCLDSTLNAIHDSTKPINDIHLTNAICHNAGIYNYPSSQPINIYSFRGRIANDDTETGLAISSETVHDFSFQFYADKLVVHYQQVGAQTPVAEYIYHYDNDRWDLSKPEIRSVASMPAFFYDYLTSNKQ